PSSSNGHKYRSNSGTSLKTNTMKLQADKTLEEMAATFRERNMLYGDNWLTVGEVMLALFPRGIEITDAEEHIIMHWISWIIGKLTRFINTGMSDTDSIHDVGVYCAMLETYIKQQKEIQS